MGYTNIKKINTGQKTVRRFVNTYGGDIAKPSVTPLSNDGRVRLEFLLSAPLVNEGWILDSVNPQTFKFWYGENDPASYYQEISIPKTHFQKTGDGSYYKISMELQINQRNLVYTDENPKKFPCEIEWEADTFTSLDFNDYTILCGFDGYYIYTPYGAFTDSVSSKPIRHDEYLQDVSKQRWGVRWGYKDAHYYRGWKGECKIKPKIRLDYTVGGVPNTHYHPTISEKYEDNVTRTYNVNSFPIYIAGLDIGGSQISCDQENCYIDDSQMQFYFQGNQGNLDYSTIDLSNDRNKAPINVTFDLNVSSI